MVDIGDTLREARLARGLTHEYVAQIIKIRPEFLEALEAEQYAALPGTFYARNFLRRYADFLDLDSSELVDSFVAQEHEAARAAEAIAVAPLARATRTRRDSRPSILAIVALLLICATTLTVAYAALAPRPNRAVPAIARPSPTSDEGNLASAIASATAEPPTPAQETSTPSERPTTAATEEPTPAGEVTQQPSPRPQRTPTPRTTATRVPGFVNGPSAVDTPTSTRTPTPTPEPEGEVVATIRALETSTVLVSVDDTTAFDGELEAGESISFGAQQQLYIRGLVARNVLVSVNGCEEVPLNELGCRECNRAWRTFTARARDCRS